MGNLIKSKYTGQQGLTNKSREHLHQNCTTRAAFLHGGWAPPHTGLPEIHCNRFTVKITLRTRPSWVTDPETWHSSVKLLTTDVESFLVPNWAPRPGRRKPFPNSSAPELNASRTHGSRGTHSALPLKLQPIKPIKNWKKSVYLPFYKLNHPYFKKKKNRKRPWI